ncbi:MAG TPA: methyltransferase domain-containing protein [Armatimonadota bacterium]|jgi:SAM-dependent methyltransferase
MQYTPDVATQYARFRGPCHDVVQALIDNAHLSGKSRVLDVGCGTGNFCIALSELIGCHCAGLDPSAGMLAQARARAPQTLFVQGRAEALPYHDASFELLFSVDVIHHVTGHGEYIQEAKRVLRPGGLLCTVTESHAAIQQRSILSVYFPETVERQIQRYPSIEALSSLMAQAGFTDIRDEVLCTPYQVTDIDAYRNKTFSCLHEIPEAAYQQGLQRLEADLAKALPARIPGMARTTLLWGKK